MVKARLVPLLSALAVMGIAGCGPQGQAASPAVCRATAPQALSERPIRWFGECRNGVAEGSGVLRLGAREPFQLFLGTMRQGRPSRGVMRVNTSQLAPAYSFGPDLRAVPPDGNVPQQLDETFRIASAGAAAVARRFAAAGNAGSAAYYRRLADAYREPPFE